MSQTNYIVCLNCGELQDIGKYVRFLEPKLEQNIYGFAFINESHRDDYENRLRATTDMIHRHWRYLQHFLMRHRGHELRVLPEQLEGPFESKFFPRFSPGDPSSTVDYIPYENYYRSATGIPNQEIDAKLVPDSVVKRLREMSRGENLLRPIWDDEEPDLLK